MDSIGLGKTINNNKKRKHARGGQRKMSSVTLFGVKVAIAYYAANETYYSTVIVKGIQFQIFYTYARGFTFSAYEHGEIINPVRDLRFKGSHSTYFKQKPWVECFCTTLEELIRFIQGCAL